MSKRVRKNFSFCEHTANTEFKCRQLMDQEKTVMFIGKLRYYLMAYRHSETMHIVNSGYMRDIYHF